MWPFFAASYVTKGPDMRALLCLAALLPLAACGGATREDAAANTAAADNGYTARVASLNEGERNAVFLRAIRDGGRDCQGVERSEAIAPVGGKPAWVATCEDKGSWIVVLGDDGVATVTDARAVAEAQKKGG